jgi:hypothetical protein
MCNTVRAVGPWKVCWEGHCQYVQKGVVHFIEVILVHVARSYPSDASSDCLWWPDIHYPCLVELKFIIKHWFPKVVRPRNRVSGQIRLVAVRMISARGYEFLSSTKSAQYELMAWMSTRGALISAASTL